MSKNDELWNINNKLKTNTKKYPVFELNNIKYKECTKCHKIKTLEEFKMKCCKTNRRNGSCRACDSIFCKDKYLRAKQLNPNYLAEHRERKKYFKINKELRRETRKRYVRTEKHRAYQREYYHKKIKTNINSKIKNSLRGRIRYALLGVGKKCAKTMKLVGCSIETFIKHIESQFIEGMSWDNHGINKGCWSLEHKSPCRLFDLSIPEHQKACFGYKNIKPLWNSENFSKLDKTSNGIMARFLTPEEKKIELIKQGFGHLFE